MKGICEDHSQAWPQMTGTGVSITLHADSHNIRIAMDWIVSSRNSYTEALIFNVIVFGNEAFVWLIRFG